MLKHWYEIKSNTLLVEAWQETECQFSLPFSENQSIDSIGFFAKLRWSTTLTNLLNHWWYSYNVNMAVYFFRFFGFGFTTHNSGNS